MNGQYIINFWAPGIHDDKYVTEYGSIESLTDAVRACLHTFRRCGWDVRTVLAHESVASVRMTVFVKHDRAMDDYILQAIAYK